jgi:hypothetical protein
VFTLCTVGFKSYKFYVLPSGSNPGGGEVFTSVQTGPGAHQPPIQWVSVGVKCPGRGVDHPPPSGTEVKGKVKLYFYSPSGPSWAVLGWNSLYLTFCRHSVFMVFLRMSKKNSYFSKRNYITGFINEAECVCVRYGVSVRGTVCLCAVRCVCARYKLNLWK